MEARKEVAKEIKRSHFTFGNDSCKFTTCLKYSQRTSEVRIKLQIKTRTGRLIRMNVISTTNSASRLNNLTFSLVLTKTK